MIGSPARSKLVRTASLLALLWPVAELAARAGAVLALARVVGATASDLVGAAVAFPTLAAAVVLLCRRAGQPRAQLGWSPTAQPTAVAIGALGAIAGLAALALSAGVQPAARPGSNEGVHASPTLAALLLLVNGLLIPVCEEWAWRGAIQGAIVAAIGEVRGVACVALAFSLKHAVVDLSLARVVQLTALGLVLGVVRQRGGLQASITTHVLVNTLATSLVLSAG